MHEENKTKERSWQFRVKWNAFDGRRCLHSRRSRKAPSFRNENKYDIWTDKLIGMLTFIYSLIISWFYGENKEKVILKGLLSFSLWLHTPNWIEGGMGETVSFKIHQKGNQVISNCSHSPSPLWILMHFIWYLTYCVYRIPSVLNSKSRKNIFLLSIYHFLLISCFDITMLLQKMLFREVHMLLLPQGSKD